jgi:hypothetical protein
LAGGTFDGNFQAILPLQANSYIMLAIRLEQKVGGRGGSLPHQLLEVH